ncbi:putative peptidase S8 family protein [Lyophyllum shimeji]|uniref:Peptidase S8 family protein n=1 Tax=Lyophyllum shimeji TaxID=47721 RepID=A0A9P3PWB9_LYOSH|nr:putative peptidase S8 family protein [Lyophyllum shimeji]
MSGAYARANLFVSYFSSLPGRRMAQLDRNRQRATQSLLAISTPLSTMKFLTAYFAAAALVFPVLASPPLLHTVQKYDGETSGKYIVKLKRGVSKETIFGQVRAANVTHDWTVINGFASYLNADDLKTLRASRDVEYIAEDGISRACITRYDAPWNLERISHKTLSNHDPSTLNHPYAYDEPAGRGVDIYIVDTGIQVSHAEFVPRARWGATFGGYPNRDDNGHGTHVAGTAGGNTYGVARDANLIAVKVLSAKGNGANSDIISGLDWVAKTVGGTRRPSVVNMSLEGAASIPMDEAVAGLVNRGIHVACAAGNHNVDTRNTSPARARGVNAVAASTIDDTKADFSNFGPVVSFWAPGQDIISAWIGPDNKNFKSLDGTSMASPHVAGLIAYFIGRSGYKSPRDMTLDLRAFALQGVLRGVPPGTVNNLVQNA